MCYHAVGLNVWSLQGNGYTVKEDEKEDDVVEHLVTDDPLTPQPEPEERKRDRVSSDTSSIFHATFHTSSPSLVLCQRNVCEPVQTWFQACPE